MAEESSKLATAKTILSTIASVAATAVVVQSVFQKYIPNEFRHFLFSRLWRFFSGCDNVLTMVIDEYAGLVSNELYSAAECYLGPKIGPATRRLNIIKNRKEKNIEISMEKDEMIFDVYNGEKLKWVIVVRKRGPTKIASDRFSQRSEEARSFELSFQKRNMDMVINSYLPHIIQEAKLMENQKKTVKIHTIGSDKFCVPPNIWKSVSLDHPATFDTLAMDSDQKDAIMKDLEMFVKRRDYYRRVGKAWKRGYLLYGPAGTGKSSLIAAIANFLNFDIYDLELTDIKSNSYLRKVLLETANRSILVVEDIDCTIDLQNRKNKRSRLRLPGMNFDQPDLDQNKVTLSGFLNFIDGLWSSCGDERIIIFTTNHKENLEPALLRPGRMDVHIHMSYCNPSGFKLLANNYLGLEDHPLFVDIEDLLRTMNVTPADVAEQLLKQNQKDGPEASLYGLLEFLQEKKRKEAEEEAPQQQQQQKKKKNDDDHHNKKEETIEEDESFSD